MIDVCRVAPVTLGVNSNKSIIFDCVTDAVAVKWTKETEVGKS